MSKINNFYSTMTFKTISHDLNQFSSIKTKSTANDHWKWALHACFMKNISF